MKTAKNARYYEWALVDATNNDEISPLEPVKWGWRCGEDGDIEAESETMPSNIVGELLEFVPEDERDIPPGGFLSVARGSRHLRRRPVAYDPKTAEWWEVRLRRAPENSS